jgi:hypothetical protein
MSTYYWQLWTEPIKKTIKFDKKITILYTFQICDIYIKTEWKAKIVKKFFRPVSLRLVSKTIVFKIDKIQNKLLKAFNAVNLGGEYMYDNPMPLHNDSSIRQSDNKQKSLFTVLLEKTW